MDDLVNEAIEANKDGEVMAVVRHMLYSHAVFTCCSHMLYSLAVVWSCPGLMLNWDESVT